MNLRQYIDSHARLERRSVRQRIADAIGVTEPCVRHYANGTRAIPSKHVLGIAQACEGKVRIEDLLQELVA